MTLDPAVLMPSLMALHKDSEAFAWKLHELKYLLERIEENTTPPPEPVYNNASSTALANFIVVKSGNGKLFGVGGVNTKASAQFILGFDLARNSAPANGTVPNFAMNAPASDNFWASWAPNWRQFREGWLFCNSSTAATLTLGSADCFFDVQYI